MTIGFLLKILLFGELIWLGKKVGFSVLGGSSIAWFMFALATFVVITSKLQNINKRLFCVVAIIIACFSGYDKSIGDWLYLSRIIVFYPFYLLGNIVAEEKRDSINQKLLWASVVALLCWLFIAVSYTSSLYPYKSFLNGNRYFIPKMWEYGYLYRALYYVIAIILSIGFMNLIPKKQLPFITTAGKRTMATFFWHIPVLHVLLSLGLLNKSNCGIFLQVVIAVSLTMILSIEYSDRVFMYLKNKVKQ